MQIHSCKLAEHGKANTRMSTTSLDRRSRNSVASVKYDVAHNTLESRHDDGDLCISLLLTGEVGFDICGGSEHGLGIFVSYVEPDSLAEHGGLQKGDQILEANGYSLRNTTLDQAIALKLIHENDRLNLTIKRRDTPEHASIKQVISWQAANSLLCYDEPERWDIRAKVIDIKMKATFSSSKFSVKGGYDCGTGVYVSYVEKSSFAWKAGLRAGMRILSVNDQSLRRATHAAACDMIWQSLREAKSFCMRVQDLNRYPLNAKLEVHTKTMKPGCKRPSTSASAKHPEVAQTAAESPSYLTDTTSNNETANNSEASHEPNAIRARDKLPMNPRASLSPIVVNDTPMKGTLLRRESPAFAIATLNAESLQQLAETNPQAANALAQAISENSKVSSLQAADRLRGSVSFSGQTQLIQSGTQSSRQRNDSDALETGSTNSTIAFGVDNSVQRKGVKARAGSSLDISAQLEHNAALRQAIENLKRQENGEQPTSSLRHSGSLNTRLNREDAENQRPYVKADSRLNTSNVHSSILRNQHPTHLAPLREPEDSSDSSDAEESASSTQSDEDDHDHGHDHTVVARKQRKPPKLVDAFKKIGSSSLDNDFKTRRSSPASSLAGVYEIANTLMRRKKVASKWLPKEKKTGQQGNTMQMKTIANDQVDADSAGKPSSPSLQPSINHRNSVRIIEPQITEENE